VSNLDEIARRIAMRVDKDLHEEARAGAFTRISAALGKNNDSELTRHLRATPRIFSVRELVAVADDIERRPGAYLDEILDEVLAQMVVDVLDEGEATSEQPPPTPVRAPETADVSAVSDKWSSLTPPGLRPNTTVAEIQQLASAIGMRVEFRLVAAS